MKTVSNSILDTLLILSLAVGFLVFGCSSNEQNTEVAELNTIEFTENLRISAGTKKALIGNFAGLAVGNNGKIYVADTKLQKIHQFSPDGNYLGSLGRKGKGPGEFDDLNPRIRIQSDTLYAMQNNARRIDLFNLKSNELFRTISIPNLKIHNASIGSLRNLFPISNGNLFLLFVNPYFTAPREDEHPHMATISRIDPSGIFLNKKILQIPVPFPTDQKVVYFESRAISVFTTSFYPDLKVATDRNGDFFVGKSDSLTLRIYGENGKMLSKLEGKHASVVFTNSDFDSIAQKKGEKFKKAVNQVGLPSHWPAFQNFLSDDKGRCYVELLNPGAAQQTWWIFDAAGNPKWKFELPAEVELYDIRSGNAYGISKPPEDMPSIVRYSIDM